MDKRIKILTKINPILKKKENINLNNVFFMIML